MNARTMNTILVGVLLVFVVGCSRNEADIGARVHRECVSIIAAAVAVAQEISGEAAGKDARNRLVFDCILQRGNAVRGVKQ